MRSSFIANPPDDLPGDACAWKGRVYWRGTMRGWLEVNGQRLADIFASETGDPAAQDYARQLREAIEEAARQRGEIKEAA